MIPWQIAISIGFLCGTVPFGLLLTRAKGIDIRAVGSGNIGATNVGRALGRSGFLLCLVLDALKGFLPAFFSGWNASLLGSQRLEGRDAALWFLAAAAPVLGHIFNPWLRFRGGKGIATSLGSLLALWPCLTIPAIGALATFAVILKIKGFMSAAAIASAWSLPIWVVVWFRFQSHGPTSSGFSDELALITGTTCLAILLTWTHRSNIRRLIAGTEPRLGRKAASRAPRNPAVSAER